MRELAPTPSTRSLLAGGLAVVAALGLAAAPARAGVAETTNACKFSYDGEYRSQGVEVTASPPAAATAGATFTLSGEELEVKLRTELAKDAAAVGLIPSDGTPTTVVTKTWFALRATNTQEGTQVIGPITVSATTTATYDEAGQTINATPFVYTPPRLPDTTWTATGGDVVFSQAGPGAITAAKGPLPVGGGGANVAVAGSVVTQANLPGGANFFMDCQPGTTNVTRPAAGAGTSFNALTALPFATVSVPGASSNDSGTPPQSGGGSGGSGGSGGAGGGGGTSAAAVAGRVGSALLTAKGGTVKLTIDCRAAASRCAGTVRLRTRGSVRIGTRTRVVTLAKERSYAVAKGRTAAVTLTLSHDARTLLKRSPRHKVSVTLKPASGKAATRNLDLRLG